MQKLGQEKKRLAPQHTRAITQVNEIVKGLGFNKDQVDKAKAELAKFMPKEVFFDKYANERGWSLLYAVYAPQIVNDFFKEERGTGEKRQSPKSRRIQYEELAGDAMDYVQSVFMGYHDDQDSFKGGVRSVAVPPGTNQDNKYAYDPTLKDTRDSECPHCGVSFWSASAGNCDPKYKLVNGKPLREWRATPLQAPEHVKFNPTTGERQEETGYSYCGGRHPVYDVTAPDGTIDVEAAERLAGIGWDEIRSQERVRTIAKDGALKHYLVDKWLDPVERLLGGKAAYMKFSPEWLFEDKGELFRECRHPISLKSPASVIHDRIARYTFNVSDKQSSGRARKIKVYMCPKCHGEFKDINDITSPKSQDPVKEVQCDECGLWFNIDELPEDAIHTMQWLDPQVSLHLNLQSGEEGASSELIETIPRRDIGYLEVEMAEIFDIFNQEITEIGRTLNIRGAEHAKDIFEDWIIGGLNYRELTEKYLAGVYKLHFTECADCGYRMDEKSNPNGAQRAKYDQGLPVALVQCPRRASDPRHKVEVAPTTPAAPQQVDPWADMRTPELREDLVVTRDPAALEKKTEQEVAGKVEDENERRKYMGTNLIYHGIATQEGVAGISYQVLDIERGVSQPLPAGDPRAYKGDQGVITREIYAPMERLIKAVLAALAKNPRIRDKHQETLDTLNEWSQQMGEMSTRFAKVKGFCKNNTR